MKIAVVGLWHLGCVTAACLAKIGYIVCGYDPNPNVIALLKKNTAPLFEPQLDKLLFDTQQAGRLHFSSDPQSIATADVVWITIDTPVNEEDEADFVPVFIQIESIFPVVKYHAFILISSQLPVGSTRKLAEKCKMSYPDKKIHFAYSPENLQLGTAIDVFMHPGRVILGLENSSDKPIFSSLFNYISKNIIPVSLESAEMTKHALNAFLATSVVFANELAVLCEKVGADAHEVQQGLKSDARIGHKAYLRPGHAIAGGTLLRDVNYLTTLSDAHQQKTHLLTSILASNRQHQQWYGDCLRHVFSEIKNKKIALLGLSYKANTNTLRRSSSMVLAQWLHERGAEIMAYDPLVCSSDENRSNLSNLSNIILLKANWMDAIYQADALILMTDHAIFQEITADILLNHMQLVNDKAHVIDAAGMLRKQLAQHASVRYFSVGSGCSRY